MPWFFLEGWPPGAIKRRMLAGCDVEALGAIVHIAAYRAMTRNYSTIKNIAACDRPQCANAFFDVKSR
jgi:hypothetical protein